MRHSSISKQRISKKECKEEKKTDAKTSQVIDDIVGEEEEDVQVLSHKDQRKLKKKQKVMDAEADSTTDISKSKQKQKADTAEGDNKATTRQNSVWVGNLSFRTTPDALRKFFRRRGQDDAGAHAYEGDSWDTG